MRLARAISQGQAQKVDSQFLGLESGLEAVGNSVEPVVYKDPSDC